MMNSPYSLKIYLLSIAATVLAACKPSEFIGPPGQVSLSYAGKSQSEFLFVLENRSAQEILLPAVKSFWSVKPWGSGLGCSDPQSSGVYVSSIWPPFESAGERKIVRVLPQGSLKLRVNEDEFSEPRYRGAKCTLTITLENSESIRSKEFVP